MATFVEFVSALHSAKQHSIVWHHQTKVYSEHKALNNFYDEIKADNGQAIDINHFFRNLFFN